MATLEKIEFGREIPVAQKPGAKKPLELKELRRAYQQLIEEAQIEGDLQKEWQLAQKYVDALTLRYEQAAKKKDHKAMNEIARMLWDGIPGSFKAGLVVQKKDTVEVSWSLLPRDEKAGPSDQCLITHNQYLEKINRLQTLIKQGILINKQSEESYRSLSIYGELLNSIPVPSQLESDEVSNWVDNLYSTLNTEELRQMIEDVYQDADRIGTSATELAYLDLYDKAKKTGDQRDYIELVRKAAMWKREIEDERITSRRKEIRAKIIPAYKEVEAAQRLAGNNCDAEYFPATFSGTELLFKLSYYETPYGETIPDQPVLQVYGTNGEHLDNFYLY